MLNKQSGPALRQAAKNAANDYSPAPALCRRENVRCCPPAATRLLRATRASRAIQAHPSMQALLNPRSASKVTLLNEA
jgi:hypothetical protein